MKKIFFIMLLAAGYTDCFSQAAPVVTDKKIFDKRVLRACSLQSVAGTSLHLPESGKKLLVFVFLSPECPLSKNYSSKLSRIKKKYDGQADFNGIIPGTFEAAAVSEFQKDYLPSWVILRDKNLQLTHYLQGKVTPEVIVLNNADGRLVYKGAIDDWAVSLGKTRQSSLNAYLEDALTDFINNKKVLVSYRPPVGCLINDF